MADPKKGTGKKPKGLGRRLYTDENPRDTVKICIFLAKGLLILFTFATVFLASAGVANFIPTVSLGFSSV